MIHIIIKTSEYTFCGQHLDRINRSDGVILVDRASEHLFEFSRHPERCRLCEIALEEEIKLINKNTSLNLTGYDEDVVI